MTGRQDAGGAVYTLSLKDELTKEITDTLNETRRLVVDTARAIDAEIKKFGQAIADTGKKVAAAGVAVTLFGAGVTAAFVRATFAAGDFAETVNMFKAVFKEQTGAVRAWAKEYATQVNRSEQLTMSLLAQSQDTFVPLGFDRAEAAELSKTVTKLAIDLSSFKNIGEDESIRRLLGALVGVTQNLRAFGVIAQEAQIKAKALDLGFDPNNLTSYQKALAILEITLEGTRDAQGDAIRTADSFRNSIRGLRAAVEDLVLGIGEPLREFGASLAQFLTNLIQGINELVRTYPNAVKWTAGFAVAIGALGAAITAIGGAVILLGTKIATMGILVLLTRGMMKSAVGAIINGIAAIAAALTRRLSFTVLAAGFKALVGSILLGISLIAKSIVVLSRVLVTQLLNPWVAIAAAIMAAAEALKYYYRRQQDIEKVKGATLETRRRGLVEQSFRDAGQRVPADLRNRFEGFEDKSFRVVGGSSGPAALSNAQQDLAIQIQKMRTPLEAFRERMADAATLLKRGTITQAEYNRFKMSEVKNLRASNQDIQARNTLKEQLQTPAEKLKKAVQSAARLFKGDAENYRRAVSAAVATFRATDRASQLAEDLKTPLERFRDAVAEARQLFAGDAKNFARAVAAAKTAFEASKPEDIGARVAEGIRDSLKSEAQKIAEKIGEAFSLFRSGKLTLSEAKDFAAKLREDFLAADLERIKSAPRFQGLATRSAAVASNIGKFAPTFDNMESEVRAYQKKQLELQAATKKELIKIRRRGLVFGA